MEKKLGYQFQNKLLLKCALTHRSTKKPENNERLEFLGDSVLSLIISTELFSKYPLLREGELSRLRANLVKGETIAKISAELGIGDAILLGAGELKGGGKNRESILAGAFEALIGAIYLDSNFESVRQCVLTWYQTHINNINEIGDTKDPKTALQELTQAKKLALPLYVAVTAGPAHKQTFDVTCRIEGLDFETHGKSSNRRKAEQIAAAKLLEKMLGK